MNSFGRIFRIHLFGESHGKAIGVVIDGCPPGIEISAECFAQDLFRRKSGASGTTTRIECDIPNIISGVYNDFSTGSPIMLLFRNENTQSETYASFSDLPRPGHVDFVVREKYCGFADLRGSGHFSGRITLPLTAAGVVAKKIIAGITVSAELVEAGGSKNIEDTVQNAVAKGDSIGGVIECKATNLPVGLGEPFFDGLESLISHIVFAIPGIKAIEFGAGFSAASMKGSEHNDFILNEEGKTKTNHAGGINGGISNGNELFFRVAVKPASSILLPQETYNIKSKKIEPLKIEGRHDSCFVLRVPPIIEAATAIALADLSLLADKYKKSTTSP
ncbi:MAG: chorismate synthase [Bacteroidales bacterium]|jgi:chorismate synthase|nr:chorismate synthase [Bacteroidales bacterium]